MARRTNMTLYSGRPTPKSLGLRVLDTSVGAFADMAQRVAKIGNQVIGMFQSDRHTNRGRTDA